LLGSAIHSCATRPPRQFTAQQAWGGDSAAVDGAPANR
jgi:hypothetical protein